MVKKYTFTEAWPLKQFFRENRKKFLGQHIHAFYSDNEFAQTAFSPVVFELDDYCLVVDYEFYSNMKLYVVDKKTFNQDKSLNFLYTDTPYSKNNGYYIEKQKFPYIGDEITDIEIKQTSYPLKISEAHDIYLPKGGDYFTTITVIMDEEWEFCICAAAAVVDGGIEVW